MSVPFRGSEWVNRLCIYLEHRSRPLPQDGTDCRIHQLRNLNSLLLLANHQN
jgi:hypothetical protein